MENQNNQQQMKKSNAGLKVVVAVICVLICLICIGVVLALRISGQAQVDDLETASELESAIFEEFAGNHYQASDGSVIYFQKDGEFIWYQDDSNHEDNYYAGTFDIYSAEEAEDYIVNELSDYGVTDEELADYFERNADSEIYVRENFCCMVLHTEELIMNGENQADEPYDKNYMGFYSDGYYDAANMSSGQYAYFTLVE